MSEIPIVYRSRQELTDGSPVPDDRRHTQDRGDGQQKGYVVLSDEERLKGWVKPYRDRYTHLRCGTTTTMGRKLSETYARDPYFYSGTFCVGCGTHFPLSQFEWTDGEPMDPGLQEDWQKRHAERDSRVKEERRQRRIVELTRELDALKAEQSS